MSEPQKEYVILIKPTTSSKVDYIATINSATLDKIKKLIKKEMKNYE